MIEDGVSREDRGVGRREDLRREMYGVSFERGSREERAKACLMSLPLPRGQRAQSTV